MVGAGGSVSTLSTGLTSSWLETRPVYDSALMPPCDARYDVILSDGYASYQGGRPETRAVVDFDEERVPDDWGEPGQLVSARLRDYWASTGKTLTYEGVGIHGRKMIWVDGTPCRARVKVRRWLRWKYLDYDPPIDPEYEDPA